MPQPVCADWCSNGDEKEFCWTKGEFDPNETDDAFAERAGTGLTRKLKDFPQTDDC